MKEERKIKESEKRENTADHRADGERETADGAFDEKKQERDRFRYRVFRMVSVGVVDEPVNQAYDVITTVALIANLAVMIMNTYDQLADYYGLFSVIEQVTIFIFAVDYILRIYTAKYLYPDCSVGKATLKYIFSFAGVIDFLSVVPYYLPVFFPSGASVFRFFRVARIMRLFRINAYYDSLNVITEVIASKRTQLLSSVFIIVVLMMASSLCMYSVENAVQPEVFSNAFSGIWWSASTLLTVGYGDIYPITTMGKVLGIVIAFLGVGVVAVPTGIISAGFVEQYTRLKRIGDPDRTDGLRFIEVKLSARDAWTGKMVKDVGLPHGAVIMVILRGKETIIPRGNVGLLAGDRLVIGAEALKDMDPVNLKEVVVGKNHEWNGVAVRDLDISRQTFIVLVRRSGRAIVPKGELVFRTGDEVLLYSKKAIEIQETNGE